MNNTIERRKTKDVKRFLFLITFLVSLFSFNVSAQDFGIYDLSAKTNLDSADAFMISQRVDSTYYKVLFDRIVDSVEDSIRGNIINTWIKSGAAIALDKLAAGTAAYFVVNNVSGVPTYVALSGDATLSNAGALTIAANAIGSAEITDGSIVTADISSTAAIELTKLASGTAAYIIVNNAGGVPTYVALGGDATISNGGVLTIAANAITSAEITDNTVASADILDGTIATADILDGTIVTADISNGTIIDEDISASAAIALSKLATGTAAYIIVNNAGGVPTYVAMSGDATISNAGVVDLADALSDNFTLSGNLSFTGTIKSEIDSVGAGVTSVAVTAPIMILPEVGAGTNISSITGGAHGMEVTFIAHPSNSENITITNGTTIRLAGAANYTTFGARDVIRFINYWGVWIESYRSNN